MRGGELHANAPSRTDLSLVRVESQKQKDLPNNQSQKAEGSSSFEIKKVGAKR